MGAEVAKCYNLFFKRSLVKQNIR